LKIFGSDGFRCKFGTQFLSFESIINFSSALSEVYLSKEFDKPILISRDTRFSGKVLEDLISSVLNYRGINTVSADVLPTPGLSKILELNNFSLGIMITASHNPFTDNGIKLLASDGFKLSVDIETEIENIMLSDSKEKYIVGKKIGSHVELNSALKDYIQNTLTKFPLKDINSKILIDCSNGAFSQLDKSYLNDKKKNFFFQSNSPNGYNINLNCGALEPSQLLKDLKKKKLDYGIAFDGDGDRAVFVSNKYGVIESEKIVCLLFKMQSSRSNKKLIVTTEISNLALKHNLLSMGADLIETEVGDRFVIDAVKKNNALFGSEPSGHFFFPDLNNSMDGLSAFFYFLELISYFGDSFNEELNKLDQYLRVQKNFQIDKNKEVDTKKIEKKLNRLIDPQMEKIVLRKSMWDPVIRVYYDYKDHNNFKKIETKLNKELESSSL